MSVLVVGSAALAAPPHAASLSPGAVGRMPAGKVQSGLVSGTPGAEGGPGSGQIVRDVPRHPLTATVADLRLSLESSVGHGVRDVLAPALPLHRPLDTPYPQPHLLFLFCPCLLREGGHDHGDDVSLQQVLVHVV